MNRQPQVNFSADADLIEDIDTMARRYFGGNKSLYLRTLIERDLDREAQEMVI